MHITFMPIIIRTKNLKIYVYLKDHFPAHVHVIGPDAEAKIDIQTFKCLSVNGFSKQDINRIIKFLKSKKAILIEAWEDYHE
jgi:hypothetical protein